MTNEPKRIPLSEYAKMHGVTTQCILHRIWNGEIPKRALSWYGQKPTEKHRGNVRLIRADTPFSFKRAGRPTKRKMQKVLASISAT